MENRFLGLIDDSMTSAPLRNTLTESVRENPDNRAKVLDISRRSGIPADAVAHDLPTAEAHAKAKEIDVEGIVARSPHTNRFLGLYDNASVAHDDIENLEKIESNLIGKTFFDNFFQRQGESFTLAAQTSNLLPSGLASLNSRLEKEKRLQRASELSTSEGFTSNPVIQKRRDSLSALTPLERTRLNEINDSISKTVAASELEIINKIDDITLTEAAIEALAPKGLTENQQSALSGLDSFAQMMPAIASGIGTSIATGNPALGTATTLSMIGAQVRGPEYWKAVQGGLNHDEALTFSLIKSTLEVGTEMLPTKRLIDLVRSPSGKKVFSFLINELAGEQLNTLAGSFTDYQYGLDPDMDKAVKESWRAVLSLQADRQKSTAIATVVGGGAQAAVVGGTSKLLHELTKESESSQVKSAMEQENLDKIIDVVENSKLKKRSPQKFKEFMQQASEEGAVYIDGPQTALYLRQQENIESDPVLSKLAAKVSEADVTNGEITIPFEDFATDFVGSPHLDALRPHITMSADTISPFRKETEHEQTSSYAQRIVEEATKNNAVYIENQKIFDDVVTQLVETGQVTPQVAKHMAAIVPAWATVVSKRTGKPVEELYEQVGLKIEGPFEGRKAALKEGQDELGTVFNQKQFEGIEIELEDGQKVDAQRLVEQRTKQRTMISKLIECLNR